ncbi:Ig-like domain repeat protein [Streptomyces sp. NPDC005012]|uniref:YncE family protein n=1 Tax=Streptomyces sp. NPDC005012 TaxID=3154558 RepID=UPI0033BCEACF
MRGRGISAATALTVLFSSAALTVAAAGNASAAAASVTTPGGLVADAAHRRVFVGDPVNSSVTVADWSGNLVKRVYGIPSVSALALSDDGATLYAAAPASQEVIALDAGTLAVKDRWSVSADRGPQDVAFSAGRVWFTYIDESSGNLGSVDPDWAPSADPTPEPNGSTVEPTPEPTPVPAGPATLAAASATADGPVRLGLLPRGSWDGAAIVDTDPSSPGLLAVGEINAGSGSMTVLDVSSGTPREVAHQQGDHSLTRYITDLDLVPGHTELLVAGRQRDAYANGVFRAAGEYPARGSRADVNAQGTVANFTYDYINLFSTISVFRPNGTMPLRTITMDGEAADLVWGDSSRLFALVGSYGSYTLTTYTGANLNTPTLTVNAPAKGTIGTMLTVTGKITATEPLPTGVRLTVTRTDVASPNGKALPSVTAKVDGTFSFSDTPPTGDNVVYRVAYAGDAAHTAVSKTDTVVVPRAKPTLTLNNNGKVYSYGKDVTFTAHLGKTYSNRTVEIWANPYGSDKPNKLIRTGKVNSSGNLSAVVDMKRDTTVTAVFKGDTKFAPRTVKSIGYAKVSISNTVSGHYRTGTIGSRNYYWFRKTKDALVSTTMSHYPRREVWYEYEVYDGGAWRRTATGYFELGSTGKVTVDVGTPGVAGIKARVRTSYINDPSGDDVNTTTRGAWKYLYFTN